MRLHNDYEVFEELFNLTSQWRHLPTSAIVKDYFITVILNNLSESDFLESVVFKGGTSLSKCYPNSIERFSEDIDLTFIPEEGMSDKQINYKLKSIEKILIGQGKSESIGDERNNRNKSSYVWYSDKNKEIEKIKLEIGSSVRPHPFQKKPLKSYIHEYLESIHEMDVIREYELKEINVNTLNIERTFIDKVMSLKRHALCGTLLGKTRHIYDVVRLFNLSEIQKFLKDEKELKSIIQITKSTDAYYLKNRNISKEYNPLEEYGFELWKDRFASDIKLNYELLHTFLLYTDEPQNWDEAIEVFESINQILKRIHE